MLEPPKVVTFAFKVSKLELYVLLEGDTMLTLDKTGETGSEYASTNCTPASSKSNRAKTSISTDAILFMSIFPPLEASTVLSLNGLKRFFVKKL